jgi:hypothetical protein
MMTPVLKAEAHKLGSDGDPIRQGLFACQTMNDLLQRVKTDENSGPFQTIVDAAKLAHEGKQEEAKGLLRSIASIPGMETRIHLWVWSALRELSEQPDSKAGTEVLGVIVEAPMDGGYDTLAAYQDGTARYLNFSGRGIFWDAPDAFINGLCLALLSSTVPVSSRAKPRTSILLPQSGAQVTLLTRSGIYAISDPPRPVVKAAADLMTELIRQAQKGRAGDA